MSEIGLTITPNVATTEFVIDQNTIQITPDAIELNVYTQGAPVAGGSQGQLQYNNLNTLAGVPNTSVANGNLTFQNLPNLKISGGSNSYFLQTDGTGNLTWAQGTVSSNGNGSANGANTQIQMTDGTGNFVGAAGFTFDYISNALAVPGDGIFTGNVTANYFIGNFIGTIANANYANFAGTVVNPTQSNITSLGTLTSLSVNNFITATQFVSNIATGTAPLSIQSTTKVGNLNADLLDDLNSSTSNTGNTIVARDANGNVEGNYFIGNGSQLTGIDTSLISNGNSNVRVFANSNVTTSITGVANILSVHANGITVIGTTTTNLINYTSNYVNIGVNTVINTSASSNAIAIGYDTVANDISSIAIGKDAKAYVGATIIGYNSTSFNANTEYATALGQGAAVANKAIAIGAQTIAYGNTNGGVALGYQAKIYGNSAICINGTGSNLFANTANSFVVKPIRNASSSNFLTYDSTTGEITYTSSPSFPSGTITANYIITTDLRVTGSGFFDTYCVPLANNTANLGLTGQRWSQAFINNVTITSNLTTSNITTNYEKTTSRTVANLANATTVGEGTRTFVSDANTTTFYSIVGGGGSNKVPVFSDGTDWRVG